MVSLGSNHFLQQFNCSLTQIFNYTHWPKNTAFLQSVPLRIFSGALLVCTRSTTIQIKLYLESFSKQIPKVWCWLSRWLTQSCQLAWQHHAQALTFTQDTHPVPRSSLLSSHRTTPPPRAPFAVPGTCAGYCILGADLVSSVLSVHYLTLRLGPAGDALPNLVMSPNFSLPRLLL